MKKIEIAFRKLLLNLLLFVSSKKTGNSRVLNQGDKVLFIRLNKIGDALVTTPLLKLLKEKLDLEIHILADRRNHFIFNDKNIYRNVLIFNKGLKGFFEVRKYIQKNDIKTVVDLHDDVSTTVSFLLALSNARNIIGYLKGSEELYTELIDKPDPSKYHVIDRYLSFADHFGITYSKDEINIHYELEDESVKFVQNFFEEKINNDKRIVGINISAGNEARFWGVDNFRRLAADCDNPDIQIVILASPPDKDKALEISGNAYPVFTNNNFNIFSAFISMLDLLFTPDTSVVHIASQFEIPVFGIYVKYRTNDVIWSPYKSKFDCVITEEPNFDKLDYENVKKKFLLFIKISAK
ncbi:MAG: glycosyltransferase family 9 protein [Ignavibacteria bacterium]|jgi:ADP-heptose:LPS heptosyltransferase